MMSALLVTDLSAEQLAFPPASPNRKGETEVSFAQSFHQGVEANPEAPSKTFSAAALKSKESTPVKGQEFTQSIAMPSPFAATSASLPRGGMLNEESIAVSSNKPVANSASSLTVQPDETENALSGGSSSGDESVETNSPTSTDPGAKISSVERPLLPADRNRLGLITSKNDSRQTVTAAKTAKPQQGRNIFQRKGRAGAGHTILLPDIPAMAPADNPPILDMARCSIVLPDELQIRSKQGAEAAGVIGLSSKTYFQVGPADAKSPKVSVKDGVQELKAADSETSLSTAVKQTPAENSQSGTGKGTPVPTMDEPTGADLKTGAPAAGSISANFEISHSALGSTPGFTPEPHSAVSHSEGGQQQHSADSGVHATDPMTGFEEHSMSGSASISISGLPRLFNATPAALEVGVQSDMHGWLKVRAELTDSGAVNASIATASPAGQSVLHRELPGLTAYLHQEKIAVNLTIAVPPADFGTESRGSATAGERTAGQAQQGGDREGRKEQPTERNATEKIVGSGIYEGWRGSDEDGLLSSISHSKGRGWLSVRA